MLAFILTIALATGVALGIPPCHATHVHVAPACQTNQDPLGGCVG